MGVWATVPVLRGLGIVPKGREEVRLTCCARERPDGGAGARLGSYKHGVSDSLHTIVCTPPEVMPPLFVRDVSRAHWFQALPENDAVYVQVNQIRPDPGETMPEFGPKPAEISVGDTGEERHRGPPPQQRREHRTYTEFLRTLVGPHPQGGEPNSM